MSETARLVIAVDSRQVGQADNALNSLGRTSSAASKAVSAVVAALGVRELLQAAESYSTLTNRMRLVTEGAVELRAAQDAVFKSAQAAGQPLSATGDLYQRIAANQKALSLSGKEVAGVTNTISKTLAISGTSAASASAALTQLGQAFASGTLRGEELNSVMEQAPALSQAIAAGMGVTVGELRALGAEGKITADAVVKALQDQADAVDQKFGKIANTVGTAMQTAGNTVTRFVGELDQATGATTTLANGIIGASRLVDTFTEDTDALASAVKNAGAVMGGIGAASAVLLANKLGTALYASRAAKAANIAQAESAVNAAQANQIAAQSAVVRAEREALAARGTAVQTQMSIQLAQARMAEAGATTALGGAQATLRTASAGLLSVLGGPVGLALLVGTMTASYFLFRDGADAATSALIDQNGTLDDSIHKFRELSAEQQRFQSSKWIEAQESALDSAASALAEYASRGSQAFNSLGMSGVESAEAFSVMVAEVKAGTRTLDSVTEWVSKNNQILPTFKSMLEQTAAAYSANGEKAEKYGKLLAQSNGVTTSATTETEKLAAAQIAAAQSSGAKAGEWDKYIAKLTETRDLLGANAAAEAEYNAVKMGANSQQLAQAKLIGEQTVVLKAYQEAVKDGNKVEQAALKTKLLGLYTAEEAATQAAAIQKQAYADTATAAENSAKRQVTAIEQAANFAIASAARMASGTSAPAPVVTGYSLLTSGGTPPAVVPEVKETSLERVERAIKLINEGTEANKKTDKAANSAARAVENQAKALKDFEAQSAISTKSSNDMADAYLSGADSVRELTIAQKIEEELLKTGAGARDAVTAAVNREADAKDRLDIDQSIASMRVETTNTLAQATATLQGADALETFNLQKSMSIALSGKKIDIGSKEYEQLLEQTKAQLAANKALEQASKVEGIVDRLNPQIKLLKDYTAERDALNTAMIRDSENVGLYQDALTKLGQEYEVNQSKATIWGQLTEGAIDRIDGVFANAWANIGSGADNLWDSLVKGAKQAFGEIAHMLTTKPLLASISNWLTGTDNGQGLGAVWGKLLGSAGGSASGGSSGLGGLATVGKNVVSAWNAVTGIGADIVAGWSSGGAGGAATAGVNSVGGQLSNMTGVLKGGFNSLVQTVTGTTAAQTLAVVGAEGVTTSVLSGAVTEGAAALGAQFSTGVTATTAATYAAAEASAAATAASLGGQFAAAMSSMAAMWPLAVVAGMYQSGKLYDKGVRPDSGEIMDSGGKTALGKAVMAPGAGMSSFFKVQDEALGKIVGGKWAAILSGSTLHQSVTKYVGEKLFGGAWETKNTGIALEVENGVFEAQQYADQKKKGGLFSSSKKRTKYAPLVGAAADSLGGAYNDTILDSIDLVSRLGVVVNKNSLDGLDVAKKKINTKGKSDEYIQTAMNDWFDALGDSAVAALNKSANAGLDGFTYEGLTTFVSNLYNMNAAFDGLGVKMVGFSVAGGRAVESLVALAGGMESLQTNISSYYDNFTSDTQKADDTLAAVTKQFSDLNLVLPGTRDGYKDMLEQLDMTGEYGQSVFNAMTMYAQNAAVAYGILEQRATAAAEAQAAVTEKQAGINANYYALFTTDAEKANDKLADITAQFAAMGVVLPATRDDYKSMVYAASVAGESGKKLFDFLKESSSNASDAIAILAQRSETLKTNAIAGATSAMSMLQRSITAQQKSASDAYNAANTSLNDMLSTASSNVSGLTSVGNDLSAALKALRGDSDEAVKTLRAQAVATLQSALATARAGGSLAGFSGLDDALDTIGSNNTDLYRSLEDFNRDQGRTANVVAELNALNGKQLTTAEKSLEGLEEQIKLAEENYKLLTSQFESEQLFAQAQLDALNGVNTSTMTVASAVAAMNAAVVAALAVMPRTGAGSAVANTPQANGTIVDSIYRDVLGRSTQGDEAGAAFWAAQLQSGALGYDQIAAAIAQGAVGNSAESAATQAKAGKFLGIPGYASGGDFGGGLRLVGEDGPEIEVTGPSRIFNANQTAAMLKGNGNNAGLEQKVDVLIDVVKQIVGPMKLNSDADSKLFKKWDRVGLPTITAGA